MPANMVYNFGAAAMRAVGDTRRPTTYLMISGLLNVGLNLVFVLGFGMAAGGVALATILSQGLSASLVILRMLRSKDVLTLSLKRLKIHRRALLEIVKIGLPAGVEGCLFSISNVLIQSSINSFGSMAMAGNAAASNIDSMVNRSRGEFAYTVLELDEPAAPETVERIANLSFIYRVRYLCR